LDLVADVPTEGRLSQPGLQVRILLVSESSVRPPEAPPAAILTLTVVETPGALVYSEKKTGALPGGKWMKVSRRFWCSLLVGLVVIGPSLKAETLKVALIDYPPFESDPAKTGGRWGYMPEVIDEIFGKQGIEVQFEFVPWLRAVRETETGGFDALPLVNSGHSKVLILSKEKSAILKQFFYVKKGNPWRFTGVRSLESIVVGSVLGYDYTTFSKDYQDYLKAHWDDPRRVVYTTGETASADLFRRILSGRVTTFNEDQTYFRYLMTQGDIGKEEDFEVGGTLGENSQFMGFSPARTTSAHYADLFDQGIRELRKSGRLKAILDSYGIADWL
jgi:polar amino acid transport system substrate-binding protein